MRTKIRNRALAVLLCCLFVLPALPAYAAQTEGFSCEKTAETRADGAVCISLEALQTGRVAPTDIVLVLDVSASMEHNTVVSPEALDGGKDYYFAYVYTYQTPEGTERSRMEYVAVHNTAPAGETPVWTATLPDTGAQTQIDPADTPFYTGVMEELRDAASSFVQSVAGNAALYEADHRIAVVEFSAREAKGAGALCTHDNDKHIPLYANILSGDQTASGALVSAQSGADALQAVIVGLHGDGATYSDDAMAQAQAILATSDRQNRVVILFTDGGPGSYGWVDDKDKSALPTANGAIAAAAQMKAQGVQIYTVGVFDDNDFSGEVREKNTRYLNYVSSDYPNAQSMDEPGVKVSDAYCSVGKTDMNLHTAFDAISAVIGVPVNSAYVQDTVSAHFYLSDAQKTALQAAYPGVRITENEDQTTTIIFENVDFPAVAVHADGTPIDPESEDVFRCTFCVTPRDTFLGGSGVEINTGLCGVFADGIQLAQFDAPKVSVPINANVAAGLLSLRNVTVFAGDTLLPEDLYTDLSQTPAAAYVDSVTYSVTDSGGAPFTGGSVTRSDTFTVTVHVRAGNESCAVSGSVNVQVEENTLTRMDIVSYPGKTVYFVGDALSLEGISVKARRKNGDVMPLTAADLTASPAVFTESGTQTVTIRYGDLSQTFTVTVKTVEAVSAKVTALPAKPAYVYRTAPDYSGLTVEITYNNGTTQTVRDLSEMTVRPQSDARVRRGAQTFTVTTHGVRASFTMQVRLVWWQWLILIFLFGWIWY